MLEAITPEQFLARVDGAGWSAVESGAYAQFHTGTFATGVEFITLIGRLADEANHHPDVDLRYGTVTVRLITHELSDIAPGGALSERDVALARDISAAARELGIEPG